MGKGWTKGGVRQRKPTLCPYKRYEGWGKGGQKVGFVRESPSFAHARGMKDGERVVKRWGSSEKAHASPGQEVLRMGKGWTKGGSRQRKPTLCPYKGWNNTTKPVNYPISTTLKPLKRNVSQKNLAIHLFV